MVAIVSDELPEKVESDTLISFYKQLLSMKDLYDNFSDLQLLENDSDRILLLSVQVFKMLNNFPIRITLITEYPNEVTFFRESRDAEVSELKWEDYRSRSKNESSGFDSSNAFDDE